MNSNKMTPDQIVEEIAKLKEAIGVSAQKIVDLSKSLHSQTRRASTDANTSAYITYSNAWMRFAGALSQGLKRTEMTDRMLKRTKEETDRQAQEVAKKAAVAKQKELKAIKLAAQKAPFGDLIELYGEEMVDASR